MIISLNSFSLMTPSQVGVFRHRDQNGLRHCEVLVKAHELVVTAGSGLKVTSIYN